MEGTINLLKSKSLFDKLEWCYEEKTDVKTLTMSLLVTLNGRSIGIIRPTMKDNKYSPFEFISHTKLFDDFNGKNVDFIKTSIEGKISDIINTIKEWK